LNYRGNLIAWTGTAECVAIGSAILPAHEVARPQVILGVTNGVIGKRNSICLTVIPLPNHLSNPTQITSTCNLPNNKDFSATSLCYCTILLPRFRVADPSSASGITHWMDDLSFSRTRPVPMAKVNFRYDTIKFTPTSSRQARARCIHNLRVFGARSPLCSPFRSPSGHT